jgi:hypothetical protein
VVRRHAPLFGMAAHGAALPGGYGLLLGPVQLFLLHVLRLLNLFLETVHATLGVHQLLTASEERMAAGADFHTDIAFVSRARTESVSAGAGDV